MYVYVFASREMVGRDGRDGLHFGPCYFDREIKAKDAAAAGFAKVSVIAKTFGHPWPKT